MRADEMIKSSGYRIGPTEVEESIADHSAVQQSVVVGAPDAVRGEIVKAYVLLRAGIEPTTQLAQDIQRHVKEHLGAYQYPRVIEFVDQFPLTTSSKIDLGELRRRARQPAAGDSTPHG